MPFTLSHTIVSPIISKLVNQKLPIAGIAIGSMCPDLYRLFSNTTSLNSHDISSVIYPNLFVGLFFSLFWYVLYRPTLYEALNIKDDLYVDGSKSIFIFLCFLIISILLGTLTHILWDGLTHHDARSLLPISFQQLQISFSTRTFSFSSILQFLSSIIPLPFIYHWIKKYIKKHKCTTPSPSISHKPFKFYVFFTVFGGSISLFHYVQNIDPTIWSNHQYYFLGRMLNKFAQAAFIAFALCCAFHQFRYMKKLKESKN
jgi:hypothetical protein